MAGKLDSSHDPEARPLGCNGRYGTAGSVRHIRRKEPACEACKASANHYHRERRRGQLYPRRLKPCGTQAAAQRHRYHGEELDFACRLAEAAEWHANPRPSRTKAA